MAELLSLWLPILASTVAVHCASFAAWCIFKHHKPDWRGLENEDSILEAIRSGNIAPGQYIFPYCDNWSDMKDQEKKARYETGPHGTLNVWPGPPQMGRNMALTLLFFLVTSVFVAYLTSLALEPGAPFLEVFQVAGTAAIMAYSFAAIPNAIWFGVPARAVVMNILDGIVFGLITAVVFGAFWPAA